MIIYCCQVLIVQGNNLGKGYGGHSAAAAGTVVGAERTHLPVLEEFAAWVGKLSPLVWMGQRSPGAPPSELQGSAEPLQHCRVVLLFLITQLERY